MFADGRCVRRGWCRNAGRVAMRFVWESRHASTACRCSKARSKGGCESFGVGSAGIDARAFGRVQRCQTGMFADGRCVRRGWCRNAGRVAMRFVWESRHASTACRCSKARSKGGCESFGVGSAGIDARSCELRIANGQNHLRRFGRRESGGEVDEDRSSTGRKDGAAMPCHAMPDGSIRSPRADRASGESLPAISKAPRRREGNVHASSEGLGELANTDLQHAAWPPGLHGRTAKSALVRWLARCRSCHGLSTGMRQDAEVAMMDMCASFLDPKYASSARASVLDHGRLDRNPWILYAVCESSHCGERHQGKLHIFY
nr:hypothetical protein CFP56_00976 [Quercus suber]